MGSREIVPDDRAVADFPEQIDDQNITWFQDIDDPGVLVPDAIFFLLRHSLVNHRIYIGPLLHKDGETRPTSRSPGLITFQPPSNWLR